MPDGLAANQVVGSHRPRGLAETLANARRAAAWAGVTRLADITHVDRIGIPVQQAVRPASLSLSVAQGKGLTRQAAMVSALLEAVESCTAERLPPPAEEHTTATLDLDSRALWSDARRSDRGIRLWPQLPRRWCAGRDLGSGRPLLMPFDLVSMDFTVAPLPDVAPSSVGLATGNDRDEAFAAAIAEALEHDMTAAWFEMSPRGRREVRLCPDSVDAPLAANLLRRLADRGFNVLLWATGLDHGVPGFQCALTDAADLTTTLPPAIGNGCHVDRETALLRAVLEAIQGRSTLITGARDDLVEAQFGNGQQKATELVLTTLSLGPAPLAWTEVPPSLSRGPAADIDMLLAAIARRTSLAVVGLELPLPTPGLSVVRVLVPGLADEERQIRPPAAFVPATVRPSLQRAMEFGLPDPRRHPIVFAGPSLSTSVPPNMELRPPAVAGDLAALLVAPPPAVGLIDGCFEIAPSVWHKEIMDLIAHGVCVVGGASLGALRAAELHSHGMLGVGHVHAGYRDGLVVRDDAVFVSHAPAALGHRALTIALVDAEFALAAVSMAADDRRVLLRIVRTTPFRRRDWSACLALFERRTGRQAPVTVAELSSVPSVKAADAALVVDTVLRLAAAPPLPPSSPPPPMTCFYADLLRRRLPKPTAAPY